MLPRFTPAYLGRLAWRAALFTFGLFIFAIGLVLNVRANLGLGPWNVFQYALTLWTPLSLGQVSQVVGLAIIGASYLLGIKPGIGTVANMLLIGVFIDVGMAWIPDAREPPQQYVALAAGLLALGFGSGMYIKPAFGAGPRDSLMLGLVLRSGWRVGLIRNLLEGTVLVAGYLLGGPVGIGTALFVLLIGPAVDAGLVFWRVPVQRRRRAFGSWLRRPADGAEASVSSAP
ncbi:MAG: membrane protein [Chloroflexi bacterium]|nr:membrane protein [Chloroflexota bacterium]MCL5109113.1 membrane protein [Chloroflexota bacterium]